MRLPNIRSLFRPDPGYLLVEMDLSGADAQVVAWEAGDEDLKSAFRAGLKIHIKNAEDLFGKGCLGTPPDTSRPLYREVKSACHALNYGASPRTLARTQGWPIAKAQDFAERWFSLHPAIKEWHHRIEHQLMTTRTIRNAWGYRRVWFGRPDGLLPEALAWIPQSTVALVTVRALERLRRSFPFLQPLLQVHDSIVFQIPLSKTDSLSKIVETAKIEIPYPDPLVIPWGVAVSTESWGKLRDPHELGIEL